MRDDNPGLICLIKSGFIGRRKVQIQWLRAGRIRDQQRHPIDQIRGVFNGIVISGIAVEGELKLAASDFNRRRKEWWRCNDGQ